MFTKRHPKDRSYRCRKCGKVDKNDFVPMFSPGALRDLAKDMGIEIKKKKKRKRKRRPKKDKE